MTADQILAEIREANLSYLMLAQSLIRVDREQALYRLGVSEDTARLIGALTRVKSYLDYGAFTPIQVAATAALNGPQDCVDEMREIYRTRRNAMVESFSRAGWEIPEPKASMFAWAPIPEPYRDLGSIEFAKLLYRLKLQGLVEMAVDSQGSGQRVAAMIVAPGEFSARVAGEPHHDARQGHDVTSRKSRS